MGGIYNHFNSQQTVRATTQQHDTIKKYFNFYNRTMFIKGPKRA